MIFLQLFVASDHLHRSGIALSGVQSSGAGDPLAKRPGAQQRTKSSKADPRLGRPGDGAGDDPTLCVCSMCIIQSTVSFSSMPHARRLQNAPDYRRPAAGGVATMPQQCQCFFVFLYMTLEP
jgi:hypothetical protein